MTEAAFKKKKNTKPANDERISTHPSYTEYSWDSIAAPKQAQSAAAVSNATPRGGIRMDAGEAIRRPVSGAQRRVSQGERTENVSARAAARTASAAGTAVGAKNAAAVNKKARSVVKIHTIDVERQRAFPMSIVLLSVCFTILVMSIVTTLVQVSEITAENSDLKSKYNSLVSEENELRLLLETRDDLRVVERVAKEELGMVKKDQVERYYLSVHKEDRIEIVDEVAVEDGGFIEDIMTFGGALVERIRGFFGM